MRASRGGAPLAFLQSGLVECVPPPEGIAPGNAKFNSCQVLMDHLAQVLGGSKDTWYR